MLYSAVFFVLNGKHENTFLRFLRNNLSTKVNSVFVSIVLIEIPWNQIGMMDNETKNSLFQTFLPNVVLRLSNFCLPPNKIWQSGIRADAPG